MTNDLSAEILAAHQPCDCRSCNDGKFPPICVECSDPIVDEIGHSLRDDRGSWPCRWVELIQDQNTLRDRLTVAIEACAADLDASAQFESHHRRTQLLGVAQGLTSAARIVREMP